MRNLTPKREEIQELDFEDKRVLVSRSGRQIYFFDEINSSSVMTAIKMIDEIELEDDSKGILIIFNSEGGDIYTGLALYDRIRSCKCKVTTIGTGIIASMAFVIFLAGDRRLATPTARFMNHQAKMSLQGKVTDIEIEQAEVKAIEEICVQIISDRTKQTTKRIKKETKIGDKYIDVSEALKTGVIHDTVNYSDKGK